MPTTTVTSHNRNTRTYLIAGARNVFAHKARVHALNAIGALPCGRIDSAEAKAAVVIAIDAMVAVVAEVAVIAIVMVVVTRGSGKRIHGRALRVPRARAHTAAHEHRRRGRRRGSDSGIVVGNDLSATDIETMTREIQTRRPIERRKKL